MAIPGMNKIDEKISTRAIAFVHAGYTTPSSDDLFHDAIVATSTNESNAGETYCQQIFQ